VAILLPPGTSALSDLLFSLDSAGAGKSHENRSLVKRPRMSMETGRRIPVSNNH